MGSTLLSKMINIELVEYEIHTDSGYIFEDISIQKVVQVESIWADNAVNGKNEYQIIIYKQ